LQENPNKPKEIGLHFLGFSWQNWGFSMGYEEKIKKISTR
jgi:hypothetical protein